MSVTLLFLAEFFLFTLSVFVLLLSRIVFFFVTVLHCICLVIVFHCIYVFVQAYRGVRKVDFKADKQEHWNSLYFVLHLCIHVVFIVFVFKYSLYFFFCTYTTYTTYMCVFHCTCVFVQAVRRGGKDKGGGIQEKQAGTVSFLALIHQQ